MAIIKADIPPPDAPSIIRGSVKVIVPFPNVVSIVDDKVNIDTQAAANDFKKLGIRKTEDETVATFSYLGLENDFTIRGEFYRQLKPLLLSDDPERRKVAELALSYGLSAMDGNTPTA